MEKEVDKTVKKAGRQNVPEPTKEEILANQQERLLLAGINWSGVILQKYLTEPDDLGKGTPSSNIPTGYKKCGKCNHIKKLYLFNKNKESATCTTGNCKECQKASASKSYTKTKQRRNYKKYYQENKEMKLNQAKKYYQENKEEVTAKHKQYLQTKKGRKVMQKAHAKRRSFLETHQGIPYDRAMLILRDGEFMGLEHPICKLCGKPIINTSGAECHIDHIIGVVNGGMDSLDNVHLVHKVCNLTRAKDQRDLDVSLIDEIIERTEQFMEAYPEKFED